jgi:CheY-like chemotaxis protein
VTRVFVLDDQEFVRSNLKEMLEADGELRVVAEAATTEDARSSIPLTRQILRSSMFACPTATVSTSAVRSARIIQRSNP